MTSPPPAPPGDRQAELGFQGSGGGAGLVSAGGQGSWPDVGDAVLVLKETRSLVRRGLAGGGTPAKCGAGRVGPSRLLAFLWPAGGSGQIGPRGGYGQQASRQATGF